ncbi:MAG: AAA family ATPase [Gemmataceae bacterium]|nr:AAA family ATPase [Gemmataceae bacterium]
MPLSDLPPAPAPAEPYLPLSYAELGSQARPPEGLWHGYLRPAAITLLTSLWKSGKTTLLSVLLSRLKTGGELAGLPVRAGSALVVSEKAPELWWQRGRALALDGHVRWLCRPFRGKPSVAQWHALLKQVARMHARQPVDLLAIDPLANLAPPAHRERSLRGAAGRGPLAGVDRAGRLRAAVPPPAQGPRPSRGGRAAAARCPPSRTSSSRCTPCASGHRGPPPPPPGCLALRRHAGGPGHRVDHRRHRLPGLRGDRRRAELRSRLVRAEAPAGGRRGVADAARHPPGVAGGRGGAIGTHPVEVAGPGVAGREGGAARDGHAQGSAHVRAAGHGAGLAGEVPRAVHAGHRAGGGSGPAGGGGRLRRR